MEPSTFFGISQSLSNCWMDEWKREGLLRKMDIKDYSICKIYPIREVIVSQLISSIQIVKNQKNKKLSIGLILVSVGINYVKQILVNNTFYLAFERNLVLILWYF